MRWIWLDRFELFEPGRRAVAVKNVTLSEDHLHDHYPGMPIAPASLLIEGMAQTAGILVGEARNFSEKVILAKIKRAAFDALVAPGDQVRFEAVLEHCTDAAASTTGRVHCGSEQIGQVDLVFSHIDKNMSGLDFPEENFVFTSEFMALLEAFRKGRQDRVRL